MSKSKTVKRRAVRRSTGLKLVRAGIVVAAGVLQSCS